MWDTPQTKVADSFEFMPIDLSELADEGDTHMVEPQSDTRQRNPVRASDSMASIAPISALASVSSAAPSPTFTLSDTGSPLSPGAKHPLYSLCVARGQVDL
jgi:hypothetical protein